MEVWRFKGPNVHKHMGAMGGVDVWDRCGCISVSGDMEFLFLFVLVLCDNNIISVIPS